MRAALPQRVVQAARNTHAVRCGRLTDADAHIGRCEHNVDPLAGTRRQGAWPIVEVWRGVVVRAGRQRRDLPTFCQQRLRQTVRR